MDPQKLLIPLMAMLAVGGIFYVVAYPYLSGDNKAQKRKATALKSRAASTAVDRAAEAGKRRKAVADSLKDLEAKGKGKKLTLEARIGQAGLTWTKKTYLLLSVGLGIGAGGLTFLLAKSPIMAGGMMVIGGLGLPNWIVNHMRKRRFRKFLDEFPGAVDIIVRGIKAGIPLGDCIRNIANESAEPVKTEFRAIVDAQAMGLSVSESVERLIERVPLQEANFFSIVITIQQKAGGNLAEALANLSGVLRDRKKMKGKIKAMSSEAKASAGIIGALPPLVATFVYLTSPGYISLLFVTTTGNIVLGGCAIWMGMGIFVMKKMISFEV